ncbi:MAG: DUF2059 domain-containing protein [Alphaproteobacteria bacterium]|nr:DUF2059 domain-containing protein [Alphaproteobacteria bacterium]MBU0858571.1 DUF2059 domain-containing protein [Alphaproteobacteria bacterium]
MTRILTLALFMCLSFAAPVWAQADNGADFADRMALATKMHEIRPSQKQIEDAVSTAANRLPVAARDDFKSQMMKSIDVAALEKQSIDVMAQTFSKAELTKMVEYFGTPEAQSIAQKMAIYQSIMMPVITQMLDKAAMEARTGAPAPTP